MPNKGELVYSIERKNLKDLKWIVEFLVNIIDTHHGGCDDAARVGRERSYLSQAEPICLGPKRRCPGDVIGYEEMIARIHLKLMAPDFGNFCLRVVGSIREKYCPCEVFASKLYRRYSVLHLDCSSVRQWDCFITFAVEVRF